jgi:hypothetical protein
MDERPIFTVVEFSVSVSIAPWEQLESYVHEITGTIRYVGGETEEAVAGTVKVLKIAAAEAINHGRKLSDVFNSHSDFLEEVYWAVFDAKAETKLELEIEPAWDDVLVLWEFEIKPEFRRSGAVVEAFETAISTFCSQGIVVAAREDKEYPFVGLDLTVEEWRQLGFVRIAGSQFVFRDNGCVNPYRSKDSSGGEHG